MYGLITALTVLIILCFLMLGGIIGFIASKFYPPAPRLHPEMYNPDGSIKPDILYAVTFEQNYDDEEDYSEDGDCA
jgi:hypothetical protein